MTRRTPKPSISLLYKLCSVHCILLILSNCLVQYPFSLWGIHTTWGAFTYPLIFITTDLTTRIFGPQTARKIIFYSMFPGLIISFYLACFFNQSPALIGILPELPLRIALACFSAYSIGQLLDIYLFSQIRNNSAWWYAPLFATGLSNIIDTLIFFSLAFYHCSNPFLNQHWPEIAMVDLGVKTTITCLAILPLYGIILSKLMKKP